MEKYLEILSKILKEPLKKVEDSYLDAYFEIVEEYGQQEIINNNDTWNKAFSKIEHQYCIGKYQVVHDENMKVAFVQVISAILSVKKSEQKIKLIPLIAYIDTKHIFYNFLIEKGFLNNVSKILIEILSNIDMHFNTDNISNLHWEKESFNSYKAAIKNKNIASIFYFVYRYEKNHTFYPDTYVSFIVYTLFRLSFKELLRILDAQKDVVTMLHLVYELPMRDKLKLAKYSNNIIFKFEVLRQVVYFKYGDYCAISLKEDEEIIIKNIIIEFSEGDIWQQFLKFYLEYPLRSPLLFKPLGLSISELGYSKIDNVINAIKINKHTGQDCKKALNICFNNIEERKQNYIAKKIFKRWLGFVDDYDGYMNTVLLTEVVDIAREYVVRNMDKVEIKNLADSSINNIKEINNRWFAGETEQKSYFYKQVSKLFVLFFAKDRVNLNTKFVQSLLEDNLYLRFEANTHTEKTTAQLFSEYVHFAN